MNPVRVVVIGDGCIRGYMREGNNALRWCVAIDERP